MRTGWKEVIHNSNGNDNNNNHESNNINNNNNDLTICVLEELSARQGSVGHCLLERRMSRAWSQKRPYTRYCILAVSLQGCMSLRLASHSIFECSTQVYASGQACGSRTTQLAGNQEIWRTQAQYNMRREYM